VTNFSLMSSFAGSQTSDTKGYFYNRGHLLKSGASIGKVIADYSQYQKDDDKMDDLLRLSMGERLNDEPGSDEFDTSSDEDQLVIKRWRKPAKASRPPLAMNEASRRSFTPTTIDFVARNSTTKSRPSSARSSSSTRRISLVDRQDSYQSTSTRQKTIIRPTSASVSGRSVVSPAVELEGDEPIGIAIVNNVECEIPRLMRPGSLKGSSRAVGLQQRMIIKDLGSNWGSAPPSRVTSVRGAISAIPLTKTSIGGIELGPSFLQNPEVLKKWTSSSGL
jgi:hypothetical protein